MRSMTRRVRYCTLLRAGLGIRPSRSHYVTKAYSRLVVLEVLIHSGQTLIKVDLILKLSPHISKDISRKVIGDGVKYQEGHHFIVRTLGDLQPVVEKASLAATEGTAVLLLQRKG